MTFDIATGPLDLACYAVSYAVIGCLLVVLASKRVDLVRLNLQCGVAEAEAECLRQDAAYLMRRGRIRDVFVRVLRFHRRTHDGRALARVDRLDDRLAALAPVIARALTPLRRSEFYERPEPLASRPLVGPISRNAPPAVRPGACATEANRYASRAERRREYAPAC